MAGKRRRNVPPVPPVGPPPRGRRSAVTVKAPQVVRGQLINPPPPTPPATPPRRPARARRGTSQRTTNTIVSAGNAYAQQAAIRQAGGGRPSPTGRTVAGAAGGAATGAALGSIVPGVGTLAGAAAGGILGGAGGAVSGRRELRAFRAQQRMAAGTHGPRRVVLAEFVICMVIASLSPLTDAGKTEGPATMIKRLTALMLLFFGLALMTGAGRGPARAAAAFGGVITLALVVSKRDLMVKVAEIFNRRNGPMPTPRTPSDPRSA